MNRGNYARYGSYYVHSTKCIDNFYHGLKQTLDNNCMSVQAKDRYAIGYIYNYNNISIKSSTRLGQAGSSVQQSILSKSEK